MIQLTDIAKTSPWLLLAGGAAIGWLKSFWNLIYSHTIGQVVKRVTVSVTVYEMDHAQAWVWIQYWAEKRLRERKISSLMLRKSSVNRDKNIEVVDEDEHNDTGYELAPAYGVYPFLWRKRYLLVFNSGEDEKQLDSNNNNNSTPRRRVTLTIWGTRNRELLLQIISEAQKEWEEGHPSALHYFYHRFSYWNSKPMPSRPMSTVYLPDGVVEEISSNCKRFLNSKDRYDMMGIPWRYGIMFYGPPGSGKTTLVQAIATELGLPLYYLSLASIRDRGDLSSLLDNVRPGSIVLIEDVDCITAAAERMSNDGESIGGTPQTSPPRQDSSSSIFQSQLTPSDLLNYIDGIIASQGRILIMTTNYPEKLDRALTRSGRVDRKWEITYAKEEQLLKFHAAAVESEMTTMDKETFLSRLPSPATIADAQSLLFRGEIYDMVEV